MSPLPRWYPWSDTESKPAPFPLLLVQAFANTVDVEKGVDLLEDADVARAWLIDAELLSAGGKLTPTDLEQVRAVRASIRALLTRADPEASVEPLRRLAASRTAQVTIGDDGQVRLEDPGNRQVVDGLFRLLLIMRSAQEDGTWSRLRACANDECRWVFYDRSRNQHGSWCDMAACGNRLKNRELRARRRH